MRYLFYLIGFLLLIIPASTLAQVGEFLGDEKNFYAATKQVNQFLRRFNGEEDVRGKRYPKDDPNYRHGEIRRKYINILFDNNQKAISPETKKSFMSEVIDSQDPLFLNFHGGSWFAQVSTKFKYKDRDETLQLFLRLQEEKVGSKWVIYKAHFEPFEQYFKVDTADDDRFIHPMSHELDFMNLRKIFEDPDIVAAYSNEEFMPDYLSLVLYEIKKGALKFVGVDQVRFHFFQLENWYFELTEFNRSGPNTGWLISNLLPVNTEQKELLMRFIYYGND